MVKQIPWAYMLILIVVYIKKKNNVTSNFVSALPKVNLRSKDSFWIRGRESLRSCRNGRYRTENTEHPEAGD